jgi:two-component system response regulator RstA
VAGIGGSARHRGRPYDRTRVPKPDPRPLRMLTPVHVGPFEIDILRRTARLGPEIYVLNGSTLRLLCLLAVNTGRVLTRDEIWGALSVLAPIRSSNVVDAMVAQLRRRLREDAAHPRLLETVPGHGYRCVVPA